MKNLKLFALTIFSGLFVTTNIGFSSHLEQERQRGQQGQERHEDQQDRQSQQGQYDQQDRQGQQHMQHMQQRQERDVQVTQLPQAVQKTLRDDYKDWKPSEAKIVSDSETHEEGSFYQVKLNKTDKEGKEGKDGKEGAKVVMISNDGEVIDEKDAEEFERETQRNHGTEGQRRY